MAERILSGKIKQLIYTTEELSQSPLSTTVIDNGVLVYEKTSSGQIKCKMGDGNNVWSGLEYIGENIENNNDCVVANIDNKVNYKVNSLNITSNCGSKWKEDIPSPFEIEISNSSPIEYNNELHFLGSGIRYYHYYDYYTLKNREFKKNIDLNLPIQFTNRNACTVYNDEIHILGSINYGYYTKHYKLSNNKWVEDITLPYNAPRKAVVYNGELHIFGNGSYSSSLYKNHYKLSNGEWIKVSTLPFDNPNVLIYNNEIHIFGYSSGDTYSSHYKFENGSWVNVSTLPCKNENQVVYKNELYTFNSYKQYKWNGSEWELMDIRVPNSSPNVIVCDNDYLYLISGESSSYKNYYYVFDGSSWSRYEHNVTSDFNMVNRFQGTNGIFYHDTIYLLGGDYYDTPFNKSHYSYDGETFKKNGDLPYSSDGITPIVYNDELHIIGGNGNSNKHYKYNGDSWEEVCKTSLFTSYSTLCPIICNNEIHIFLIKSDTTYHYKFNGIEWSEVENFLPKFDGKTVVYYRGEIHLLGGYCYNGSSICRSHYKYNGVEWIEVSTLPFNLQKGYAFVINDELHIFGGSTISGDDYTRGWNHHYKWDGIEWTNVEDIPINYEYFKMSLFNSEIHIFSDNSNKKLHYTFGKDFSDLSNADILTVTIDGNKEVPLLVNKMSKNNPTGTGSLSMNRAEGSKIGENSVALGSDCKASGMYSIALGNNCTASGSCSHAEGYYTTVSGSYSHAEGYMSKTSGGSAHSEGCSTNANYDGSHSEGSYTKADNYDAHAEGTNTVASGKRSHAEGYYTKASSDYQHVQGKYNIEDASTTYAHIVGGGTSNDNRKNIHTLDWNGNAVFSGDVTATDSNGNTVSLIDHTHDMGCSITYGTTDLIAGTSELANGTLYIYYEDTSS